MTCLHVNWFSNARKINKNVFHLDFNVGIQIPYENLIVFNVRGGEWMRARHQNVRIEFYSKMFVEFAKYFHVLFIYI